MNIECIIEFIKNETPENEVLLNAAYVTLYNLMKTEQNCIDNRISELLLKRDYVKVNQYVQMSKMVSDIMDTIDSFGKKCELDIDDVTSCNEKEEADSESEEKESNLISEKRINYEEFRVDESKPFNLMTDFRYMRPAAFSIDGVRYPARLWKLVYLKTCELLWEKNSSIFESFVDDKFMQGKTRTYFSKEKSGMVKPELINETEIFVETNLSANSIRDVIIKMLEKYRIPTATYQIYLSKDLTPLHNEEIKDIIDEDEKIGLEDTVSTVSMEKICEDYDVKTGKCLNENAPYFIMECCKQERCSYIHKKKTTEQEPEEIYVLSKKILKKKVCPKCGMLMKGTMFLIGFDDNGERIYKNVYGCLCKGCGKSYITEGTYNSFTRNKDLKNIKVNFIKDENRQLSIF